MSRPEILFPLFADLETLVGVGPKSAKALAGLGVERPKDLLFLLPHSGVDRARRALGRRAAGGGPSGGPQRLGLARAPGAGRQPGAAAAVCLFERMRQTL